MKPVGIETDSVVFFRIMAEMLEVIRKTYPKEKVNVYMYRDHASLCVNLGAVLGGYQPLVAAHQIHPGKWYFETHESTEEALTKLLEKSNG